MLLLEDFFDTNSKKINRIIKNYKNFFFNFLNNKIYMKKL